MGKEDALLCGFCSSSLVVSWPQKAISREIFHADANQCCITRSLYMRREESGEVKSAHSAQVRAPTFVIHILRGEKTTRGAAMLSRPGALAFYFREDRFQRRRGSVDNGSTGSWYHDRLLFPRSGKSDTTWNQEKTIRSWNGEAYRGIHCFRYFLIRAASTFIIRAAVRYWNLLEIVLAMPLRGGLLPNKTRKKEMKKKKHCGLIGVDS